MKQTFIVLLLLNFVLLFVVLGSNASSEAETSRLPVSQSAALGVTPLAQKSDAGSGAKRAVETTDVGAAIVGAAINGSGLDKNEAAEPAPGKAQRVAGLSADKQENCSIVGPFRDEAKAGQIVLQLQDKGIESTLARRDSTILPDYMVYVGPMADFESAQALEEEIKSQGRDVAVIGTGRLRNAISLGVFSRALLAEELVAESKELGFDALITSIGGKRRGFQVQASLPQPVQRELRSADIQIVDCPQAIAQR